MSQHIDTSKDTKAWAVSQHIDTSKDTKAWDVSQHIDDRLYSAIPRSLEQTHCARMWFNMSD